MSKISKRDSFFAEVSKKNILFFLITPRGGITGGEFKKRLISETITSDKAQSWLLTTYLDEDTRISRGDGGSVFVLVKDLFY